jgi:hypothetical protein
MSSWGSVRTRILHHAQREITVGVGNGNADEFLGRDEPGAPCHAPCQGAVGILEDSGEELGGHHLIWVLGQGCCQLAVGVRDGVRDESEGVE